MISITAPRSCFVAILLMLLFVVASCFVFAGEVSGANHDRPHLRHHAIFAKIPTRAQGRTNPLANDPEAVPAGKKLFTQHCAECHGDSAQGIRHKAPNLHNEEVQNATPGSIFWILSNGIIWHGMPDWSKLPEAQRWQITTYIKSLAPSAQFKPIVNGAACLTEVQNAAGVCPDNRRPERSVMVPEIMIGNSKPTSSK